MASGSAPGMLTKIWSWFSSPLRRFVVSGGMPVDGMSSVRSGRETSPGKSRPAVGGGGTVDARIGGVTSRAAETSGVVRDGAGPRFW